MLTLEKVRKTLGKEKIPKADLSASYYRQCDVQQLFEELT